ncbi:Sua5/YciO/YrdC/YwlC family protein [Candidatus Vondammii sp. HM_W22]|uniref:Sua5/YciO/YrdC/YwlC family protein n=1 Tax=Candidatus Vondammii sp. HM_W22 TaxID=2687299 RepID=UPI001F12A062|nr:Sua5/YciO/YrdC/YwlC family protein [Candidatus Vondammii sp. HM_W22]
MNSPLSSWRLKEARRYFREGGVIAYPTEAVYGLGCDPLNGSVVHRLLALKQRPVDKGFILIAADFNQLKPYISELGKAQMAPVFASWPGPHTWLLPTAPNLPYWLCGKHNTLAVRVTDHPIAASLCLACDSPLVSTSANRANLRPARSSLEVKLRINAVDYIINAPLGNCLQPTSIRDARTGQIIRF